MTRLRPGPALLVLACGIALGIPVLVATKAPVRLLEVSSASDTQVVAVLIHASEPVAYTAIQPDSTTVLVDLREAVAAGAAITFTGTPGGPVTGVSVEEGRNGTLPVTRVRLTLKDPVVPRVRSARSTIRLEFDRAQTNGAAAPVTVPNISPAPVSIEDLLNATKAEPGNPAKDSDAKHDPLAAATVASGQVAQPPSGQPPQPAPAQPTPVPPPSLTGPDRADKQYTGHPVTMDFQNVDLRSVLRAFVDISGLNIVIDPAVQGVVDIYLKDVPWDQALDIILKSNKLGYTVDGTVVRIAPLVVLAEEEQQRRKLADEQALSGELRVVTHTLSYARAGQLAQLITRTSLSARGQIQVDDRTNTLIITDLPERLQTASTLIRTLDRPEPQVEIEARIVQTSREFARAIGVQLGVTGRVSQELGNTTGLAFPNRGALTGRTGGTQGPNDERALPTELAATAVNLGVSGAASALGISLGALNGAFNLDIALSALERSGKGRVLSTPRVSTQNNIPAEVTQGIQIPIQTVANNTVTVTFKDAALTLRVTPQITSASTVIMQITLENASPDFSRQVNGIPPIDTQRANTQVQVNDGATTVIGGIFVSREQSVTDRTPVLHRIPLLGWLFKRDSVTDESRELLIFITPRILKT